ncbi:hypothetical protein DFJ74DRAFT_712207 [Hyaloraphidium curvatum]|nr:hypothetical protein DFJ74DRAFT_712207 [Hyaloraphidium curvatum]
MALPALAVRSFAGAVRAAVVANLSLGLALGYMGPAAAPTNASLGYLMLQSGAPSELGGYGERDCVGGGVKCGLNCYERGTICCRMAWTFACRHDQLCPNENDNVNTDTCVQPCPAGSKTYCVRGICGSDGRCHEPCPDKVHYCADGRDICGSDNRCRRACPNGRTYCDDGQVCDENNKCRPACVDSDHYCKDGFVCGTDNKCHPECGYGSYCAFGRICGENRLCYPKCIDNDHYCKRGFVCGTDNKCHPECPPGSGFWCADGAVCGADMACHWACGAGNRYCPNGYACRGGSCHPVCGGSVCINGAVCGSDGKCHAPCGASYCVGAAVCGQDGKCHAPCGGSKKYCKEGTRCASNGMCVANSPKRAADVEPEEAVEPPSQLSVPSPGSPGGHGLRTDVDSRLPLPNPPPPPQNEPPTAG